jgi:hypothetical protein
VPIGAEATPPLDRASVPSFVHHRVEHPDVLVREAEVDDLARVDRVVCDLLGRDTVRLDLGCPDRAEGEIGGGQALVGDLGSGQALVGHLVRCYRAGSEVGRDEAAVGERVVAHVGGQDLTVTDVGGPHLPVDDVLGADRVSAPRMDRVRGAAEGDEDGSDTPQP